MSYIVPVHRPSGVRHALKLNFLSPTEEAVVIAKANRLEIYAQSPSNGLVLLYSKSVYGYITMLEKLPPPSISTSKTDHLFIGTDRYQYFTCSWDPENKQLRTEQSYVDQADKVLRDSREMDRCHIDPSGRYMTLELYDGTVTVIPIGGKKEERGAVGKRVKRESTTSRSSMSIVGEGGGQSGLGEPVQIRIEELQTRSSCFVEREGKSNPRLAMLWEDNDDRPQLKIRELKYYPSVSGDAASVELETVHELREELDLGVSHLVPVSAPWGGCLVLGERSIVYVDELLEGVIRQDFGNEATTWRCWEKVDNKRWLLADEYGRLYFLMIEVEKGAVTSWKLDLVGTTSQASCLIYLDEGLVFVGSHSGDSQVVRLQENGLEVLETFDNIAPIVDFNIMDLGRGTEGAGPNEFSSGQARIVTASGAWQDGSIRSVRSGVGMEEIGIVGRLSHITDLWAFNSKGAEDYQDTLLVTFVDETRILKFDSEAAVEEVDSFCGLELTQATLYASNLPDHKLLQVHETGVIIADVESGMAMSQWKPTDTAAKITSAAANSVHLLVVEAGHTLHLFHLNDTNNFRPSASKTFPQDSQISSVTLPTSKSSACIVSFWQTASIAILDLHSLEAKYTQALGTPGTVIPRSILVADILPDTSPTLFISMADGTVVTYTFDPTKNTLSNPSRIILGSEPVFFKTLPRTDSDAGISNIFASCEQPSLIYSAEGRIVYSAVNAEKSSRVCHFNLTAYPDAIAIATPGELKLAEIGSERTTQLQTLPIGETVRCISYVPEKKLFGMGCIRRILEGETEGLLSSVKIADEVTFRELDSVELLDGELVECIISSGSFEGEDGQQYGDMFVVGTSLLQDNPNGDEVAKGRVIIFEVTDGQKITKVTEMAVKGACRSLAMCDGKIVAGLVKTVVIYGLLPTTPPRRSTSASFTLNKLATYRTSTNPLSLSVYPSTPTTPATIAVADLMKSVSILELTSPSSASTSTSAPSSSGWVLAEVARHFATIWSSAVTAIGQNEWLLADMEGNILILRRNVNGVTPEDRKRLEVVGEMRIGEVVNKIIPIGSSASSTAMPAKARRRTRTESLLPKPDAMDENEEDDDVPPVMPKAFLATVEGGVYMFGSIADSYINPLIKLQNALAEKVQAPGYMPWAKWRALRNEVREAEEPFRVIDGELVEEVLRLDEQRLQSIVSDGDVGWSQERVKSVAEGLRRLY